MPVSLNKNRIYFVVFLVYQLFGRPKISKLFEIKKIIQA